MRKILAVSGSPRRGSNTEILVNSALEPLLNDGCDVERFFLSEKTVGPCIACYSCKEEGSCTIDDDLPEFLESLLHCDAIVVGSPVYTRNISAQLLALFNRLHFVVHQHPFNERICFGGAIAVGGSPNSQGIILTVIHNFLLSLGICCVPGFLNGVSVVACEQGEVSNDPQSLRSAGILGKNILKAIHTCKR